MSEDPMIRNLETLLARGGDAPPLRFALATRYLAAGTFEAAIAHAEGALALDAEYSAAWKLLGKAQAAAGRDADAVVSYRNGIAAAERRGDLQAAKEMRVFLRRLEKASPGPPTNE
jgi:predicted Zn-dependent protease